MFIFEDVIAMPDGSDAHVNDGHIGHLGPQLLDHPCKAEKLELPLVKKSHLETPANGQAVVFLTGFSDIFLFES